jgi:hypothetical protein
MSRLVGVEHELRDLRLEYTKVENLRQTQTVSIERNLTMITKLKQSVHVLSETLLPKDTFAKLEAKLNLNLEKVRFSMTDLKNLMMTTDVYIDKFLPFKMNKEMSSFLQYVMSEEQMRKLKIVEKQKL